MNTILRKVSPANNNEGFCFYVEYNTEYLDLTIFQHLKAYKVHIEKGELESFALIHKLNADDYYNRLVSYFVNLEPSVEFILDEESFIIYLNDKFRIKYFYTKVTFCDYKSTIENVLFQFYDQNRSLQQKGDELKDESNHLRKINEKYETKLKELVIEKNEIEEEILGRFVLILNDKKAKIQHLTELLEAFRNNKLQFVTPLQLNKKFTNQLIQHSCTSSPPTNLCNTDDENIPTTSNTDFKQDNRQIRKHYSVLDENEVNRKEFKKFCGFEKECNEICMDSIENKTNISIEKSVNPTDDIYEQSTLTSQKSFHDDHMSQANESKEYNDINTQELLKDL